MLNQIYQAVFVVTILLSLATLIPVYAESSGDIWNSIKNNLSDAEKAETEQDALAKLQISKELYENHFKNAALSVDAESNVLIENAFLDSKNRLSVGDVEQASLNRQIIDKTIYKIAFMQMELAVREANSTNFIFWYDILDKKFSLSENKYVHDLFLEITNDSSKLKTNGQIIINDILEIFKMKTFEEIEEAIGALQQNDIKNAKKLTYEGLYYYRTFHPAVIEKLGEEDGNELLHEMEEAVEITSSGKDVSEILEELEHISSEVELLIREYEGGNTSTTGLILSGIKDRLNLVDVEYADSVKDGVIINQEEYDETMIFLTKAKEIFIENKNALEELSVSDVSSLEQNLSDIENLVLNKKNPNQVTILVSKSLNNIASLEEYSGGVVAIDVLQYIDQIEILLNQAKQEYRDGNSQNAYDLVSKAYLDNYEFVEGPLGEVDHELMEKIEIDLREDLRMMIRSNSTISDVEAQIDMILDDLEQAKVVVPEFGVLTAIVLVIAIVSVITLTSKTRLGYQTKF